MPEPFALLTKGQWYAFRDGVYNRLKALEAKCKDQEKTITTLKRSRGGGSGSSGRGISGSHDNRHEFVLAIVIEPIGPSGISKSLIDQAGESCDSELTIDHNEIDESCLVCLGKGRVQMLSFDHSVGRRCLNAIHDNGCYSDAYNLTCDLIPVGDLVWMHRDGCTGNWMAYPSGCLDPCIGVVTECIPALKKDSSGSCPYIMSLGKVRPLFPEKLTDDGTCLNEMEDPSDDLANTNSADDEIEDPDPDAVEFEINLCRNECEYEATTLACQSLCPGTLVYLKRTIDCFIATPVNPCTKTEATAKADGEEFEEVEFCIEWCGEQCPDAPGPNDEPEKTCSQTVMITLKANQSVKEGGKVKLALSECSDCEWELDESDICEQIKTAFSSSVDPEEPFTAIGFNEDGDCVRLATEFCPEADPNLDQNLTSGEPGERSTNELFLEALRQIEVLQQRVSVLEGP